LRTKIVLGTQEGEGELRWRLQIGYAISIRIRIRIRNGMGVKEWNGNRNPRIWVLEPLQLQLQDCGEPELPTAAAFYPISPKHQS